MAAGWREWSWPSSLSLLYLYCNLICEILRALIINPKGLDVHPLGSIQGHTILFELALLFIQFCVVRVSSYRKSFVYLFITSYFCYFFKCVTLQI